MMSLQVVIVSIGQVRALRRAGSWRPGGAVPFTLVPNGLVRATSRTSRSPGCAIAPVGGRRASTCRSGRVGSVTREGRNSNREDANDDSFHIFPSVVPISASRRGGLNRRFAEEQRRRSRRNASDPDNATLPPPCARVSGSRAGARRAHATQSALSTDRPTAAKKRLPQGHCIGPARNATRRTRADGERRSSGS